MAISWETLVKNWINNNIIGGKMEKAIYKVTNLINGKIYIGQSVNPEQRFKSHLYKREKSISLINRAVDKYGKENFTMEILEWTKDYNKAEKRYIAEYRSLTPYGYNQTIGGENPPIMYGENNPATKISNEIAQKIIKDLLNWNIPRKTIVANYKVTQDIVRHINEGDSWRQPSLTYPIRPQEKEINSLRVEYIQYLCCHSGKPLNHLGAEVGWARSSAKMINQGKNHFDERLRYPIRNNSEYNKQFLTKETCTDYLRLGE